MVGRAVAGGGGDHGDLRLGIAVTDGVGAQVGLRGLELAPGHLGALRQAAGADEVVAVEIRAAEDHA